MGLIILLQSCFPDPARVNIVSPSFPKITVSSSSTTSGEFVKVTVKTLLALSEQSYLDEASIDFNFGICFIPEGIQGCRRGTTFALPEGIRIMEGETNSINVNRVVKRGEYIPVEHTFSFTSVEPIKITLIGIGEGSSSAASLPQDYVAVTFK
jgi:hypothetical protein